MPPHFQQIDHLPNRTVLIDGLEHLFFSGTSYLGLPQNPDFQALIREGLQQYGSVYGSSRNGNLQLAVYEQAEEKLAAWAGSEAALTLSSGMLAGQAVVRQLWLEGYEFMYSPDAHPAVWHTPQVEIPAVSFEEWALEIGDSIPKNKKIALITNSTDALRGKPHDFEWVKHLPNLPIALVVDDSHGLGVRGSSVFRQFPHDPQLRTIVTASLAKGMGLAGGVIFSDKATLQTIRNSAYFAGCSPVAPHQLWAYLFADALYAQAQTQLEANIALFISEIKALNLFSYDQNYPVFYTEHDDLYSFLLQNQVLIYSFSYPKPTDKANTRVVLSAWHTAADIQKLGELCQRFVAQNGDFV